jgi:hypothetical protein
MAGVLDAQFPSWVVLQVHHGAISKAICLMEGVIGLPISYLHKETPRGWSHAN